MPQVKATPINGARIRKPDGAILALEGEVVERSSFWLRRVNDGDVSLTDVMAASAPATTATTEDTGWTSVTSINKPKK